MDLHIIATTIQELFGGKVEDFLSQSTLFLSDFTYLRIVTESLVRRSLIDQMKLNDGILFTPQPMVMKYVKRNHPFVDSEEKSAED